MVSEKMQTIEKPWGKEEILEKNPNYVVKRLTMKRGCRCSLQYHEYKTETIYVISGKLHVSFGKINLVNTILQKGEFMTITPNEIHRMNARNGEVVYLECSTPQLDDVVRIEDDYKRK